MTKHARPYDAARERERINRGDTMGTLNRHFDGDHAYRMGWYGMNGPDIGWRDRLEALDASVQK